MATIRVPGPPPQAFRKNRPTSDLIKSQIKHFQHLEHKLQLNLPTKFSPHGLTTEAAAAQYIGEMTTALRNRTPAVQQAPIRAVPSPKPDSMPATRSATKSSLKSTRQSRGMAIAASAAAKKPRAKKHAPAKHSKKKS